jgi:hypothetical protein
LARAAQPLELFRFEVLSRQHPLIYSVPERSAPGRSEPEWLQARAPAHRSA